MVSHRYILGIFSANPAENQFTISLLVVCGVLLLGCAAVCWNSVWYTKNLKKPKRISQEQLDELHDILNDKLSMN